MGYGTWGTEPVETQTIDRPLEGTVAIVTGASRGIGRAIALGYASAGASVCCAARTLSEVESLVTTIEADDGSAVAARTDVLDLDSVTGMVDLTLATFGKLDILVINAGVNADRASIHESDPRLWVETINTNLVGAYYCVKAAMPHLAAGGGHIITIGSGRGHRAHPGRSAYSCSKAGLWMLTRALAEEVWQDGVCVNEIVPGPVDTDMHRDGAATLPGGRALREREWTKPAEAVVSLATWLAATPPATGPTGQSFSLMRS